MHYISVQVIVGKPPSVLTSSSTSELASLLCATVEPLDTAGILGTHISRVVLYIYASQCCYEYGTTGKSAFKSGAAPFYCFLMTSLLERYSMCPHLRGP